jgi:hypothetical protein
MKTFKQYINEVKNQKVPKESLNVHIELGWSLGMHMKGQS